MIIIKKILKKLFEKVILLMSITFIAFVLMNISRVDPAESYVRRHATIPDQQVIEKMRIDMGLDKPIIIQYATWISRVLRLDFGKSLITGNSVLEDLRICIKPTLIMVGLSVIIIIIFTALFGIISAVFENRFIDKVIKMLNVLGVSVPNFWVGFLMLYLFAVKLKFIPSVSTVSLRGALLPSITMAILPTSYMSRLIRANMIDEIRKDYVSNLYARGIKEWRIILIHVFKNAVQSVIPVFFQNVGYLIISSATIEAVFSWPGIGTYSLHAIIDRDFPVVVAFIMLSAFVFSVTSILSEISEVRMNKRLMENGYE